MEKVTAYKSTDNSLHACPKSAAMASLTHLGSIKNNDRRNTSLDGPTAAFIVENYKAVRDILNNIDRKTR